MDEKQFIQNEEKDRRDFLISDYLVFGYGDKMMVNIIKMPTVSLRTIKDQRTEEKKKKKKNVFASCLCFFPLLVLYSIYKQPTSFRLKIIENI